MIDSMVGAAREILAPYIADPTRLNPMADPAQINPLRSATMRLEGGSMFSGGLPLCLRIEVCLGPEERNLDLTMHIG